MSSNARAGDIAGTINKDGYRQIRIDGKSYLAHRLVVLYMTGEWPKNDVDHRDTDPGNDRWENLREATDKQNAANQSVRRNNKLGVKGVSQLPDGKYRARITIDGRGIHLGVRDTAGEAAALYRDAANKHHGEFARFDLAWRL